MSRAPLTELAQSFMDIIGKAGGSLPDLDIVVEGMRSWLRRGYPMFQWQVERTFRARITSKPKAAEAMVEFYKTNKLKIAELLLSEGEIK
jgi:hypothetical protein